MALPSLYEQTGLSVTWADPLAGSRTAAGTFAHEITAYSHEHSDIGGFYSASVTLTGDAKELEQWLSDGLARHIVVHDNDLFVAWEGFVNRVMYRAAGLEIGWGNVIDLANRTLAIYTDLNVNVTPPTTGPPDQPTPLADDTASQRVFGIWEKWVTAGTCPTVEATHVRDMNLVDLAWPTPDANFGMPGQATITLECLGYWAWLMAYTYEQLLVSGTQQVDALLVAAIAADPNGIFSADYSAIAANAWATAQWQVSGSSAWEYIKHLVSLGDANDVPYSFGVYEGRKVRYQPMGTEMDYMQYVHDPTRSVYRYGGTTAIPPWQVRPARWLLFGDLLVGMETPATIAGLMGDPRFEYLRSVRYQAPLDLTHSGSKTARVDQALAKLGLYGAA